MHPLAETGVGRRDQPMSRGLHQGMHLLPGPSRRPGAVTDQKCLVEFIGRFLGIIVEGFAIVPACRVV